MTDTQEDKKSEIRDQKTIQDWAQPGDQAQPTIEELQAKVATLEAEVKKFEEIAKKAQYDYVMLKYEFDSLVNRTKQNEGDLKLATMRDNLKKFVPFVEELRQTVEHMPVALADDSWAQGVKLIYDKLLVSLKAMGVEQVESIGMEPDSEVHEPMGIEPTQEETLKGKIIKEFSKGYVLKQGDVKTVIMTAKVIVGQ